MAFNTLLPKGSMPPSPFKVGAFGNYLASQESGVLSDAISIGSFVFDYAGEVSSTLRADITDHYAEDNTVFQDHIALTPIRVTMKGLIGELVQGPVAGGIAGLLGGLQSSLTTVNAYIGGKTPQAITKASKAITQVQKVTTQISSAVSKGKSLIDFLNFGALSNVKQAVAYRRLEAMWENRTPFRIHTPYKIYENMVIEELKATQPEDTKYLSEFTVTLKQMRFATLTVSDIPNGAEQRNQQISPQINQGLSSGDKTILDAAFTSTYKGPFR